MCGLYAPPHLFLSSKYASSCKYRAESILKLTLRIYSKRQELQVIDAPYCEGVRKIDPLFVAPTVNVIYPTIKSEASENIIQVVSCLLS